LLRIAIDAPPGEPSPPVWEHNPFRKQQQKEKYDRDLAVYQAAHNAWRGRTELKTQAFRTDLSSLLAQNADAPTTDIWSALHRADIFLSERDTVWGGGSVRWAVFITDGEDTSRSAPAPNFTSGARLVVVNGAGSLGVLGRFNPLVFESPAAAFHHIATTSGNLP
jgi:hypothetical protein